MSACLRLISALAVLLSVTACAPILTGEGATSRDRYSSTFVTYAIHRGPMPVRIIGNPSGLSGADFQQLTLSRLRLEGGFGAARFAIDPQPRPDHDFHVVLAMNPLDRSSAADDLCDGSVALAAEPAAELYIKGAFCRRGRALTTNFARLPRPADFQAPIYEQALGQVMTLMMPFQDPPGGGTDCERVGRLVPAICR